MRQILSDSQQNPQALMDHMKNPMVSDHLSALRETMLTRFPTDRSEGSEADQRWYYQDPLSR